MKNSMRRTVKKTGLFDQIREVVKKIPRGKVVTYGQVAKMVGLKDARKVGWAMHGNQDPEIPCHRVVKTGGWLAKKYSLGGWKEQRRRLEEEEVKFVEDDRANMEICEWKN
jgi:methylated-DNA-protein-cysteine methyltransferase-like protein